MKKRRRTIAPYLRALRRKSMLSQADVAFLLGTSTGTRVSRHETGQCIPPLEVVLAYAVIFDAAIDDIYHEEAARIIKRICTRARTLHEGLADSASTPLSKERRVALAEIIRRCSLMNAT
jgi:DNA-binding XRE family transcriptional regulator